MIIPCYNEDPALLARVLESCRWQTRQPDAVVVTDDGSTVSYAEVQAAYPDVIWLRTVNRGKKHAQSEGFREVPWADIFLTLDSDSALERRAIEEGLKPFADPRVQSVAAVEMASNWRKDILTRAISRSLAGISAVRHVQPAGRRRLGPDLPWGRQLLPCQPYLEGPALLPRRDVLRPAVHPPC